MSGFNWNWDLLGRKDDDIITVKSGSVITISDIVEKSKGSEGNGNLFSVPDASSHEDDCLEVPGKPPSIISIDSRKENAGKPPSVIIIDIDSDEDKSGPNPSNFGDELPTHSKGRATPPGPSVEPPIVEDLNAGQSSLGVEFLPSFVDGASNDLGDNDAEHECDSSHCEEDEARSSPSRESETNFFIFLASSSDGSSEDSTGNTDSSHCEEDEGGSSPSYESESNSANSHSEEDEAGSSLSCETKLSLVGLLESSDTDDSDTRLRRIRKAARKKLDQKATSKKFKRRKGTSDPSSVKACLKFPVGRIHRALMYASKFELRITDTAAVYTTSVLEHLTKTFLKLSGNVQHIKRITTFFARHGMLRDREFYFLLNIMLNYGLVAHVEKMLEFNRMNQEKESEGQSSKS